MVISLISDVHGSEQDLQQNIDIFVLVPTQTASVATTYSHAVRVVSLMQLLDTAPDLDQSHVNMPRFKVDEGVAHASMVVTRAPSC